MFDERERRRKELVIQLIWARGERREATGRHTTTYREKERKGKAIFIRTRRLCCLVEKISLLPVHFLPLPYPRAFHFLPLPLIMKSRHASFVSRSSLLLLPFYGDTWILPVGERKNEKKESVRDEGEREFKKWRIGMSEERETQHHQPIKRKKKKLRIPFLPLSHLSARRLHNSLTYRWTTISLPFPFTYMEKGKRERLCEWRKWE